MTPDDDLPDEKRQEILDLVRTLTPEQQAQFLVFLERLAAGTSLAEARKGLTALNRVPAMTSTCPGRPR